MSKGKAPVKKGEESKVHASPVNDTTFDPALASLFASSSGPVATPVRKAITSNEAKTKLEQKPVEQLVQEDGSDNETESTSESESSVEGVEIDELEPQPRKRRRISKEDDLETSYLNRLAREEEKENSARAKDGLDEAEVEDGDDTSSSASNDLEDLSDLEEDDAIPQHESLTKPTADYDKIRRTVFLGNVSTDAIRSKTSRKQLEAHLRSVLDADAKEIIESIRFRSTAYNVTAGPKKAAYAKKDLMDETTKCTNAYAVFSSENAAKKVAKKLNGTNVLDRHLHTDWLAHPTATDHKRCVFVGNLNFVDLESNVDTNEDGEKQKRSPKAKEPADAEEGLWRAFSKCGTVESVRVIRDQVTRIGKGFAYVQFTDEVATEKALALDGKKFPPMLPRLLRVSRAKRVSKKELKRKRDDEEAGPKVRRAGAGPVGRKDTPAMKRKKLDGVVFEGYRASADKAMKFKSKGGKKKKTGGKPTSRSSRRGAAFKASGGQKARHVK